MSQFESLSGATVMFDGPDWVGKTTQIKLAEAALNEDGHAVHVARAHGGTPMGEALREVSLRQEKRSAEFDFYISLAMHDSLATELKKRRALGEICLVDRSPLSMWAYQMRASGLNPDLGRPLMERDLEKFHPELLIVYRAPWATLKSRAAGTKGSKQDYFESKSDDYSKRVIAGFDEAARAYGAQLIDASGDMESVHKLTMEALAGLAKSR